MKKVILIVSLGLLAACGNSSSEVKNDSTEVKSDTLKVKIDSTLKK
jgi:ABC-type Fe3+-citrate transport system substrate-binding protein